MPPKIVERGSRNRPRKRPNIPELLRMVGGNAVGIGVTCPRCGKSIRRCLDTKGLTGLVRRYRKCQSCKLRLLTFELPAQLIISVFRLAAMTLSEHGPQKEE